MKLLLLLLPLLLAFKPYQHHNKPDYYITYVHNYRSTITPHKKIMTVLVFKRDSARTYIEDVGHVWWKIADVKNMSVDKYHNILTTGQFLLSNGKHHSVLIITHYKMLQLIYLDGDPPLVLNIEMKVKKFYSKKRR